MSGVAKGRFRAYLELGRVSNLPTVGSNVLAGAILSGAEPTPTRWAWLAVSMACFYIGGMFLNDAFDREVDARERPERPIPSGRVTTLEVSAIGVGLLSTGALLVFLGLAPNADGSLAAVWSALALAGLIVLYDVWHKQNPLSSVVMGACRAGVYLTCGLAAGGAMESDLVAGAVGLCCYVVGLTFTARSEGKGVLAATPPLLLLGAPFAFALVRLTAAPVPALTIALVVVSAVWLLATVAPLLRRQRANVPRAVVRMIAGISLVDATLVSLGGSIVLVGMCVAAGAATLALQRVVTGT